MHLKNIGSSNARTARAVTQAAVVLASLTLACGLTACTRDYTLAYVYVTTNKAVPGVINQYKVDYESGAIVQFGTPIAAGSNPIASVAAPDATAIYVVNQGDSTVQEFSVQSGGTLAAAKTYKTTGTSPTAIAVDPAGKFLFVTCTFQGANTTGPGALSVFPIASDNSLGTPVNVNVGNNPVAVTIANFNPTVYVVDQDPGNPQVLAFSESSTGTLTPVAGTSATAGVRAGIVPSAIAEDPTGRFVYVTDKAANQLIGYLVQAGGSLVAMVNGPFTTGLYPVAVLTDPRGQYVYVANFNANSVGAYVLNTSTGTPSAVAGAGTITDTGPVALALDPALGIYLYTANQLGSTVSGEKLNANTGVLGGIQNSPFPASASPSSVVIVANGSHPTESLLH